MSEILFEYIRQGVYVKVTAIEPDTKTEVSVVVPANLSREQMNLQALQKLNYVLRKKSED